VSGSVLASIAAALLPLLPRLLLYLLYGCCTDLAYPPVESDCLAVDCGFSHLLRYLLSVCCVPWQRSLFASHEVCSKVSPILEGRGHGKVIPQLAQFRPRRTLTLSCFYLPGETRHVERAGLCPRLVRMIHQSPLRVPEGPCHLFGGYPKLCRYYVHPLWNRTVYSATG